MTEPARSVSPISPARAIEDIAVGATDRLPADTDASEPIGLTRRASDGFDWNASGPKTSATRASSQGVRSSGNRKGDEKIIRSAGRIEENARADSGMETPKRDRPEAGCPGQRERSQ